MYSFFVLFFIFLIRRVNFNTLLSSITQIMYAKQQLFHQPRTKKSAAIILSAGLCLTNLGILCVYFVGPSNHTLFFFLLFFIFLFGSCIGPPIRVFFPNSRICGCYEKFNDLEKELDVEKGWSEITTPSDKNKDIPEIFNTADDFVNTTRVSQCSFYGMNPNRRGKVVDFRSFK